MKKYLLIDHESRWERDEWGAFFSEYEGVEARKMGGDLDINIRKPGDFIP